MTHLVFHIYEARSWLCKCFSGKHYDKKALASDSAVLCKFHFHFGHHSLEDSRTQTAGRTQDTEVGDMSSDIMEVSALGRPITLGMLYDAVRHKVIPGITLWDIATLKAHTVESPQYSSEFEILTSDSIEDKSSVLGVNGSLKACFLSGLVEVGGSGRYLNDKKKHHHQSRVTLQYKATTTFKQLSMTTLGSMDTHVFEMGLATHVVTGILYGANAFFVFDSEKLEHNSVQDIHGGMKVVVKNIPNYDINGEVDIKLTDKEKSLTDKFSCKFFGDFFLERNPATFEKAVKTYINLPKLLGEKSENAVPLKVWLMPLKYMISKPPQQMTEISVEQVRKVQNALEGLHHLERRCNDMKEHEVVKHFPKIHEKLSSFQELCTHYTSALQQTFAKKIPLIKTGEEDETELEKVFKDRDESPFSQEKLNNWLDDKEREITIISSCVDTIMGTGTKIITGQSELDREALAPGGEHALCLVFTSLETTELYLQELADYVDPLKLQGTAGAAPPAQDPWYFSDEAVANMREKAKDFHDLAEALKSSRRFRFLAATIANEKYKGANIYHYKDGILATDDFSRPDLPPVDAIKDRSALIWYACVLTLDPNTANNNLTLSGGNTRATHGVQQSYPDQPERFDCLSQVLCREGLTGRCYWEVEWSTTHSEDVAVGVSYKGMSRKGRDEMCRIGWNAMSWCLGHRWSPQAATLYAEHNHKQQLYPLPATSCTQLGVFLDWSGGTLSFYKVSSNTLTHLHTFHAKFTEPLYPAFNIWRGGNYVRLNQAVAVN
ncbi:stonustoxin subunit alpha-like [Trachinotus anak]|uniref:stonustoxin subunit alpha-like n=1 Tax=Trachinotus anak TaxID=443729 RepID=UPI0039F1AE71